MQQLYICCPEDWIQPCPVHGTIHLKACMLSGGGARTIQHVGILWYASKQDEHSSIAAQGRCTLLSEVKVA